MTAAATGAAVGALAGAGLTLWLGLRLLQGHDRYVRVGSGSQIRCEVRCFPPKSQNLEPPIAKSMGPWKRSYSSRSQWALPPRCKAARVARITLCGVRSMIAANMHRRKHGEALGSAEPAGHLPRQRGSMYGLAALKTASSTQLELTANGHLLMEMNSQPCRARGIPGSMHRPQ